MITRIEIGNRREFRDPRGEEVGSKIRRFLGLEAARVRTRDVYRIEADLRPGEAERVVREFADPVLHDGALGRLEDRAFDVAVTVAYKPGVTDPVGKSARVAIEDTLGRDLGGEAAVYTSTVYLFEGLGRGDAERVALELLANPLIHTIKVETREAWEGSPPDLSVPKVEGHLRPPVRRIDLSGSDEDLLRISREGLLALSLREMRAIRDQFVEAGGEPKRRALGLDGSPTDAELECLAQTWSEHCKHKIFNATITYHEPGRPPETIRSLFNTYIRGATTEIDAEVRDREGRSWLVSVFHDNAGVVAFDERVHLVYKVETHNSPSALDPYGGAITGIVGVNRDPFGTGLGADLLVNVWGYCFASPFHEGDLPRGLLHPRRVRDGVHWGVIDGGNQSGIPYGRGWEIFDARYLGKPLVYCGTVGSLPVTVAGRPGEKKAARPGDLIVMTGGRIGADGIHGATFSSAALDESSPVQAVQIGDPITQKRMFDFLLEAREEGLYEAITDNGAGGLSSSVGEMARDPGGARLDLSRAPLKYAGLAPWEILVSEAQERMTLAVPPGKIGRFLELARRREVEATVLGEFTDTGSFHVTYGEETVACLSMAFLHGGDPDLELTARWSPPSFEEPGASARPAELNPVLLDMLGRLNLCSGEAVARHYDHEVKGLTVVKPYVGVSADVPAEATVFLARHPGDAGGPASTGASSFGERARPASPWRGFVLSEGVNPFYSDIDTHAMAMAVVDEALRRQLCAGARLDRIALLDNFCWPDPVQSDRTPDGAYKLAQLVRACRGLYEAARAYGTPLVSGKDSMKNESTMGGVKICVPPTLLVSALGRIDDVRDAVTLDPKRPGDAVFLLGSTADETGGSEYFRYLGEREAAARPLGAPQPYVGIKVPRVDPERNLALYCALASVMREGIVRSAATPAKGGLALALARCVMAGELGLDLNLDVCPDLAALAPDVALFSESCGRFVVTTSEAEADDLERRLGELPCRRIGRVTAETRLRVRLRGATAVDLDLSDMKAAFKGTLADV
jgi:phosphoribosylformylglycinamidine synthase